MARAVQGVGAAIVNVAVALVGAAYPDRAAKARAVGLWTGIAGVGLAIGDLGGVLTEAVGWRWIFLINPIVGVVAVALTFAFVAESTDPTSHSFDPVESCSSSSASAASPTPSSRHPSTGSAPRPSWCRWRWRWSCRACSCASSCAAPTR